MLKHQQSALPLLRSQPAPNNLRCKHPLPANNRSLHSRVSLRETCRPWCPPFAERKATLASPRRQSDLLPRAHTFAMDQRPAHTASPPPHSSDSTGDLHRSGTTWIKPSRKCNKNRCGLR